MKLLFDCSEYIFGKINELCDTYDIDHPISKYKFQKRKQTNYMKLKRKPKKRTKKRIRELLHWTRKGLSFLQDILNQNPYLHADVVLCDPIYDKLKTIRAIYVQHNT